MKVGAILTLVVIAILDRERSACFMRLACKLLAEMVAGMAANFQGSNIYENIRNI
jgi:hypothetical protein